MFVEVDFFFSFLVQFSLHSDPVLAENEFFFAHCTIVEWHEDVHEDLVEIEDGSFLVQHDRLLKLRVFANCDRVGPDDEHLVACLRSVLDDLPCEVLSDGKADDEVVDEGLLAPEDKWLQLFDVVAEDEIDNLLFHLLC